MNEMKGKRILQVGKLFGLGYNALLRFFLLNFGTLSFKNALKVSNMEQKLQKIVTQPKIGTRNSFNSLDVTYN